MGKATLQPPTPTQVVNIPPGGPPARPRLSARGTFAALSYPNYRLWFFGQMISLFGTWMQSTAQGYLVFELTRSPAYLGYVGFAAGLPSWLFMLYAGVIADRMPRRKLLMITQSAMMGLAFVLAGLTFSGLVQPWHIVGLAFCLGVANAFDAPGRQAFVTEMVERKDLTNAIALNSTMFNSATAVGPAVAGLVYAALGPAWCFTINGATFLAVISALAFMKLKPIQPANQLKSALGDIRRGFSYVAAHKLVRTVILNLLVVSVFGISFVTLIPAWAVDILGGDATTNGYLQSARGVGALIGALMLAATSAFWPRGKLLAVGSFVFPLLLLVFSTLHLLPVTLLALLGIGWGFMITANASNSLVQAQVPDELRGRVMSIYTLAFFGFIPIGSLLAGAAAAAFGAPLTVRLGAS
ncbi:MAG TPA: MFS transporter, partial [Anaerolineales bacterium]|nr:MFS transporter [Anaerolineales bacterium]